ncbi:MAG: hypothetical protein ABI967_16885 [bacterium]
MKVIGLMFVLASFAITSGAQAPSSRAEPPDVAVVKFSWSKERINWEGDPFGGPVESFDNMRVRTRNEKRVELNKGSAEEDRIKREAKADEANVAASRTQTLPRYVFLYKISIRNTGSKQIKAMDWDYVFFDYGTENETGRLQVTSEETIGPGKSKDLKIYTPKPPAATVSAHKLYDKERGSISEQVIITRIEYADGTVWQRP